MENEGVHCLKKICITPRDDTRTFPQQLLEGKKYPQA